jgi:hypothetical protein
MPIAPQWKGELAHQQQCYHIREASPYIYQRLAIQLQVLTQIRNGWSTENALPLGGNCAECTCAVSVQTASSRDRRCRGLIARVLEKERVISDQPPAEFKAVRRLRGST